MKLKKHTALLLAASMALMTACGGAQETDSTQKTASEVEEAEQGADQNMEQDRTDTEAEKSGEVLYALPTEPEEAAVYVEPIENLPEDFIRGVDISSVLVEENSGVVYYNEAGEEQDIFQTLAENGVNYIRVRLWNDPYDENGNGYGGGNNDTATAAEVGRRAAQYGMKLCVDFHYSDFWADPSKQMCPKAWEDMAIEEKSEALYQYTRESLQEILEAGADVGMVQIGNEINYGMSGETDWTKRRQLLQAGSKAVREVSQESDRDIRIAVHFTDVSDTEGILQIAQKLQDKEIDYDIFAVSYYPFWHGTMENLTEVLKQISEEYGKEVMVAENSYPYTTGDGDGNANSIGEEDILPEYPASVQGQTHEIRDVCAAVATVGKAGIGYFYWEPAWIPVNVYEESADNAAQVLADNKEAWESKGAGWASSYAAGYDPKDAGQYYGGSSWDNQALFDYEGHPLASLQVFKYLQCGTIVEAVIDHVQPIEINVDLGGEVVIPEQVPVICNDRSVEEHTVIWDEKAIAAIDTDKGGTFVVAGFVLQEVEDGQMEVPVTLTVKVCRQNLLSNSSFEEKDTSMWKITGNGTDFQNKAADAYSGDYALHFWSNDAVSFTAEQTVTGLEPGTYEFGFYLQGGDAGDEAQMYAYADNGTDCLAKVTGVDGWVNWQNPVVEGITVGEDGTLTVGASVTCAAKGWGTLDDFYLYRIDE
ncbi:MAG: glycosyl hydrolase 53 family protein [Lachnospiraceae bacterium]|nr:glycosyl hydrolase 53 family protein [Lachnospiraceae bacterium]